MKNYKDMDLDELKEEQEKAIKQINKGVLLKLAVEIAMLAKSFERKKNEKCDNL